MPVAAEPLGRSNRPARAANLPFVFAGSIALTAFADVLFFRHPVGWTAALFTIAFLIAAAALRPARLRGRSGKLFFILLLGLAISLAQEPGPMALALMALFLPAYLLERQALLPRPFGRGIVLSLVLPLGMLFTTLSDMNSLRKRLSRRRQKTGMGAFLNGLVPLLFAGVFLLLFRAANPIFERYIDAINIDWRPDFSRIMIWTGIFALVWGALRLHRTPFRVAGETTPSTFPRNEEAISKLADMIFSPSIILRSLVLFNFLFLLQNGLDIAFLWSGAALPEGVSYAEYAHRGAYPLIVTAWLAGAFVVIALRPGSASELQRATRVLVALWLFQNVLLVLSSIMRLNGYGAEYSLTYLRLYAFIWMGLVAWGLLLIAVRLWLNRPNAWLVQANLVSLLAVLYAACFVDFGGIIASYNVSHCRELTGEGTRLDLAYLVNIGPSALPALLKHQKKLPANAWADVAVRAQEAETELYHQLWANAEDWRVWTYRNYRLRQIISQEAQNDSN